MSVLKELFPTYEDEVYQLPLSMLEMLKLDLAIGALKNVLRDALPEVGPLTGRENCVPPSLYQLALTIGDWTRPPSRLPENERNFVLSEYPNLVLMSCLKYGFRYGFPSDTLRGLELSGTGMSCDVVGWAEFPK